MASWLRSAVFYEIYPNSFMDSNGDGYGDFKGITAKLDYIKELGANAIWLNPHYDSPFKDGGYDVRDYFKVSSRFGTEEDFDEFIAAAHARGIKVILDLVPGHTSEENADFVMSSSATPNDMYDRYIWTNDPWACPQGFKNNSGRFDRNGSSIVNFFSTQPALNYGFNEITEPSWQMPYTCEAAKKTREWLKSVMRFWLDRGADGFRVDMADSLVKNDGDRNEKPATSEIWRDVRAMLDAEYPDAVLVSEWSDPQAIHAGFHADFMLCHPGNPYCLLAREENDKGENISYFGTGQIGAEQFAEGFVKWFEAIKSEGHIAIISCNHDTPRLAPTFDPERLKLVYATLFTLPGIPFIYYGDEIGMKYVKGLPSVECGFHRTGSRTPMQWSMDANAGFSTAEHTFLPTERDKVVNVAAQQKNKKSLLNFFKEFLAFRASRKEFISTDFKIVHAQGTQPLVYKRGGLTVVVNPTSTKQNAPTQLDPKAKVLFSVGKDAKPNRNGSVTVPPMSLLIFE